MTRKYCLNKVSFCDLSVLTQTFIDSWGEDDVVMGNIAKGEAWEVEPMTYWLAMCSLAGDNDVVIDCGAYTGLYSLLACKFRPLLRSIAIEASAMTYGRLTLNIYLNGLETAIIPCHYALYDDRPTMALDHQYGIFTMASGESVEHIYEPDHQEYVPSISMDSLLGANGAVLQGPVSSKTLGLRGSQGVTAIKVDVEGAEDAVLRHSSHIIERHRPFLLVEIWHQDNRRRIEAFLSSFGYTVTAELPGSNIVFSHQSKLSDLSTALSGIREKSSAPFSIRRLMDSFPSHFVS